MWNTLKTTLLLATLTGLLVMIGGAFGGRDGLFYGLLLAGGMNFFSYWFSDRIVLMMHRAQEVGAEDEPRLYGIVAELTRAAKLPMPKVYVIPTQAPNAFATGRNPEHAAVAVTAGLLHGMPESELRGVLAHELGHVANRDILIATIAATLAGAISMLARMLMWGGGRDRDRNIGADLLAMIVAPLAATIVQLAVSRSREYAADEYAARLLGDARPLMSALQRIEGAAMNGFVMPSETASAAHMYIANPISAKGLLSLFRTHPLTEDRIARLQEIDRTMVPGSVRVR